MIYLSHILTPQTPTYGNRYKPLIEKKTSISEGAIANNSYISITAHAGTHVDMPYHFFDDGQTIEDFSADFWYFHTPLFVTIEQEDLIIRDDLLEKLQLAEEKPYDIIIVKTGICHFRHLEKFWKFNYGFHPDIYEYIVRTSKFKNVRIFGFDSISVSSFQYRHLGRDAHKAFLNPKKPILLLEDMDLSQVGGPAIPKKVIVSPFRVSFCDGVPCTVFAELT